MILLNQIYLSFFTWFSTPEGQGFSNFLQSLGFFATGVAFLWKNLILPRLRRKRLELIRMETKPLEKLTNHLDLGISFASVNDAYSCHTYKTINQMAIKRKVASKSAKKKVTKKVAPKKSAEKKNR